MSIRTGDRLLSIYDVLSVHTGGMGVVYVVRDVRTGDRYAAKTIKEEYCDDPKVLRRFEREVRTWIRLGRHPNLVEALFVRQMEGAPFLFLEYVDGPTLAQLLLAEGPLPPVEALGLSVQFARGLIHAQEQPTTSGGEGLVHRDIKPANLFVTSDRIGKVSDLGIVKVASVDLEATAEGVGLGTPLYVSPEQLKGSRGVDGRADIYSFGAVLYEMLTGRPPLRADSLENQIYLVLRSMPEPPSRFEPGISPEIDEVVLRCLAKDPGDRFAGFRPLEERLRSLLMDRERLGGIYPRSTCATCGFASRKEPGGCPVCGGQMGAAVPGARSVEMSAPPLGPESPPQVSFARVEFSPRTVSVGEPTTVRIRLTNHGSVAARRCRLEFGLPDTDTFRLVGTEENWRGEVPAAPIGGPVDIEYSLIPLREGRFALPMLEVSWARDDGRETAQAGEQPLLNVSMNESLPFVGRGENLKASMEFLGGGNAGFLLVEGEAGAGSTRFVRELRRLLEADGCQVFAGKAMERARDPMKAVHDIARRLFGAESDTLGASSLMARVIDRLDPLVGKDRAMAGFFAAELRGTRLPAAQERMRSFHWFRLMSALARRSPVAILLEDLQWTDEETLDLLDNLIRRAMEENVPLAVVGTTLTSDADERTRRLISRLKDRFAALATNSGLTCRIVLRPLGEEHVVTLLEAVFPGNTFAEDHPWLARALTRQTGGNPFHLVQLLALLGKARDGEGEPVVSAEGGSWTLKPDVTEASLLEWIPEGAEDMVRAMLEPLAAEVRDTLETAAIIGEEFEIELLETLAPEGEDLFAHLEALEQCDLIRMLDDDGRRFRFTGSLIPLVLERSILERSRLKHRRLHKNVASALETTLGPRGLRRSALRYARHLRLAGERQSAFEWMVTAATSLVDRQLFLRADDVLIRAGRILDAGVEPETEVLGSYYHLRGAVSRVRGRLPEALRALEQAVDHLSGTEGRQLLAATFSKMGKVHEARGETERALYSYQLGAQIREDIGDRAGMAHSLNNLGSIHLFAGDEERAMESFRRARRLAEETGNVPALGSALDHMAGLLGRRGEWEQAAALYRESRTTGEESGDRLGVARSLNGLGTIALRRGMLEEALAHFEKTFEIRREVGDREGVANVLSNLGVIHVRRGDYEEALRCYRRSGDQHREIGSRRGLATVLNNMGVVNLTRGEVDLAASRFAEALGIREATGDRERVGLALQNLGEAHALGGRRAEARDLMKRSLAAFRDAGDELGEMGLRLARGDFARLEGDLQTAADELAAALKGPDREPRLRALLHLEMAELLVDRGEHAGADRAASRGFDLARAGGDRLALARAHRLMAGVRVRAGDNEAAIEHFDRAEDLLTGLRGVELLRTMIARTRFLQSRNADHAKSEVLRAEGLLEALEAGGCSLPERAVLDGLST